MSEGVPSGYTIDPLAHYSREHLWVRLKNDLAVVGVSDLLGAQVGGGQIVGVKPHGADRQWGDEIGGWDAEKATLA